MKTCKQKGCKRSPYLMSGVWCEKHLVVKKGDKINVKVVSSKKWEAVSNKKYIKRLVLIMAAEEINQARRDGEGTARLTSLVNKILRII